MSFLDIDMLSLRFGGLKALQGVSISVPRGTIFSIIGPNGAGKTSFFNVLTGIYRPTTGHVHFLGKNLECARPSREYWAAALVGVILGALLVCAVNIEQLWAASISSLYVFRQPFHWGAAVSEFAKTLREMPGYYSLVPFLFGLLIGGAAALRLWGSSRRSPHRVAACGITRTFQNIRLFHQMSAVENVLVGLDRRLSSNFVHAALRLPRHRRETTESLARAREILAFVGLAQDETRAAGTLPYGSQRRLEIARALASSPQLLLLDEPAAGMNPSEAGQLMALIQRIRDTGVSVLLIEHQMKVVMGVSDRIAVLDYGVKIAEGTPEEIRANRKVIEAYLGTEDL